MSQELYQGFEEEEEELADGEIWKPEPDIWESPSILEEAKTKLPKLASILPSQFAEYAFRMPNEDGEYSPFSFEERKHLRRIYDTPSKRVLLTCSRQCEKSTSVGNVALCYSCMVPAYRSLYVSPSATQTKTFSNDRIKEPIETSPILKRFTTKMLSANILEKQFVNRSKITMRYAFLNADRTRGIPSYLLAIDEFQDVLSDCLPVIEQCLSHAPEKWRRYIYAGTPKSLDNNIEYYRTNMSTQGEWVVPCDRHTPRYWNILGEKNIGRKGLVCEKCKELINPRHQDATWARMVEDAPFEGYRITQLMVPWKPWSEVLLDYERYSRDKFYNEVLGISYDSGLRPLTSEQVRVCCKEDIHISDYEKYRNMSYKQPFYMGLDFGSGENSYTVVSIATYIEMRFRVIYMHRFIGEDTTPTVQMEKVRELVDYLNIALIGTDYGGGFDRNDTLIRWFGPQRVWKYQYMARCKKKVEWDSKLGRFKVHRTEVMSDIFNAIKRGNQCEFPRWEEFKEPHGQDMLNIFSEYNKQLRMIQYKHRIDKPDDSFHSLLYCWLVSMIKHPRPDIICPRRQDERGVQEPMYSGVIEQQ